MNPQKSFIENHLHRTSGLLEHLRRLVYETHVTFTGFGNFGLLSSLGFIDSDLKIQYGRSTLKYNLVVVFCFTIIDLNN